ncbi:hypothetical protein GM661_17620 [Iocasia frigidifontis]|uniref:PNPLA domain-containing protein n=1 Tax=Iocasia fonsfrigidae TaxID=2682810 RepID=A0A8A7KDZ6_9FIRM|nr:patatin-like phospholipase family protein [Iocasia fonsfrigidae]QTL99641.1 hypothetical protein GM661_17620 [Iocasia fonsfrigidae]
MVNMRKYRRKYSLTDKYHRNLETGLVLSGGGAKGAYQAGVIKGLLKMGIKFDLVTGSSIGAFNAVLLAEFIKKGLSSREIGDGMEEAWMKVDNFLTLNWSGFLNNFFNPCKISSIFSNKIVKAVLNSYIPVKRRFSDYRDCQLSVTGTNLNRKKLRIFDYNSDIAVIEAVLGSMAFPVAFPAVNIEGDNYIDGGALCNAPLREAIMWGTSDIYVVFLSPLDQIEDGYEDGKVHPQYSALEVIAEFIDMAFGQLLYGDLHRTEQLNGLIKLLNQYESSLPAGFLAEMRKLYGLKHHNNSKMISINKIAPAQELDPPGIGGFNNKKVIEELIKKGERDSRQLFKKRK